MLRTAAVEYGITAVTLEAGESMRLQADQVELGVKSIYSLLKTQKMYSRNFSWGKPEPTYYQSRWLRANTGGILFSRIELGDEIKKGEVLGTVGDPITNEESQIIAPFDGRIIGMAVNQIVMPGFAAYHIGIEAPEEKCRFIPETGRSAQKNQGQDSEHQGNIPVDEDSVEERGSILFDCAQK
ncbi:MAG: succinylglutamate desuccinylase/aspartoacylase family protein [Pseudomonadales bacterium]|nr:succinylglutamate desuccinylase/aspartoacylase family protein [Pseudomonadales bacterium]